MTSQKGAASRFRRNSERSNASGSPVGACPTRRRPGHCAESSEPQLNATGMPERRRLEPPSTSRERYRKCLAIRSTRASHHSPEHATPVMRFSSGRGARRIAGVQDPRRDSRVSPRQHLERVLREYCAFNTAAPRQGLSQSIRIATRRPIAPAGTAIPSWSWSPHRTLRRGDFTQCEQMWVGGYGPGATMGTGPFSAFGPMLFCAATTETGCRHGPWRVNR